MAKTDLEAARDVNWEQLLEELQSGGSANFIFAKKPKNRIRLIRDPKQPVFAEVSSTFRRQGVEGTTKTKYMILAVDLTAPEDDEEVKVKGLIVSKTVFRSIVALITEGYEFFDPTTGHGVTISKSGVGLQTQYSVMPSQKAQPLDPDLLKDLPLLSTLQEEYVKLNSRQGNGNAEETAAEDY